MTAPDTVALIRDVYLQIEKHIVLCHVTQVAWNHNKTPTPEGSGNGSRHWS
jgi:hypothetical protein